MLLELKAFQRAVYTKYEPRAAHGPHSSSPDAAEAEEVSLHLAASREHAPRVFLGLREEKTINESLESSHRIAKPEHTHKINALRRYVAYTLTICDVSSKM